MKKFVYPLLGLVFVLSVQSCLDNQKAKMYQEKTLLDHGGVKIVHDGLEGGMTEIKASSLAATHSQNPRVINFAKMMITDHTKADSVLSKMEFDKMLTEVDSVSGEHQVMIDSLAKKTGPDFDKAYMAMMIKDHEDAIDLFEDQYDNKFGIIQDFVRGTLPVIKMHLDSAKAIAASLK